MEEQEKLLEKQPGSAEKQEEESKVTYPKPVNYLPPKEVDDKKETEKDGEEKKKDEKGDDKDK